MLVNVLAPKKCMLWINNVALEKLITPEPGDLKVTYHPLYSMNKFMTNKSKLPQDGTQVFPYMG